MLWEQDRSDASVGWPGAGAGGGPQGVGGGGGGGRHEGGRAAKREIGGQAAAEGARAPLLPLHTGLGHLDTDYSQLDCWQVLQVLDFHRESNHDFGIFKIPRSLILEQDLEHCLGWFMVQ